MPFVKDQKRLYAVVTDKRNRIISEGSNSYIKTHPIQSRAAKQVGLDNKIYCHAELVALIRSKGKGNKLHVARVDSKGTPCNAAPCLICQQLIKEHGNIHSVEFTV